MDDKELTIDSLFSDAGAFDEEKVLKALHPHVTVQTGSNQISFKGTKLSSELKILAYALTKKLLKFKGYPTLALISAQEIHKATGIKKGTVDPTFKILRDKGFFVGKKKEYEIPDYKVPEIVGMLERVKK